MHIFRLPTAADWIAYDQALNRSAEDAGAYRKFSAETEDASATLWDSAVIRVSGYGDDFCERAEWRGKIPLSHKHGAVRGLAQVFTAEPPDDAPYRFDPEEARVYLDAGRNGKISDGLLHILQRPSTRQQKEYSRLGGSALFVRGSRTAKTILPSRLRELIRLYDQLILSVEGYTVNGAEPSREQVIQHMDALHKQTVINELFEGSELAEENRE